MLNPEVAVAAVLPSKLKSPNRAKESAEVNVKLVKREAKRSVTPKKTKVKGEDAEMGREEEEKREKLEKSPKKTPQKLKKRERSQSPKETRGKGENNGKSEKHEKEKSPVDIQAQRELRSHKKHYDFACVLSDFDSPSLVHPEPPSFLPVMPPVSPKKLAHSPKKPNTTPKKLDSTPQNKQQKNSLKKMKQEARSKSPSPKQVRPLFKIEKEYLCD